MQAEWNRRGGGGGGLGGDLGEAVGPVTQRLPGEDGARPLEFEV